MNKKIMTLFLAFSSTLAFSITKEEAIKQVQTKIEQLNTQLGLDVQKIENLDEQFMAASFKNPFAAAEFFIWCDTLNCLEQDNSSFEKCHSEYQVKRAMGLFLTQQILIAADKVDFEMNELINQDSAKPINPRFFDSFFPKK